mgnify:CR=1 FL=1
MPDERLTCLIPTHNRPQFLRRMLQFYSQFPTRFAFFVVDSGNPASAAEHLALVESWKSKIDIEYRYFDLNFVDKCARGLELIRTPYVVLCAHDDLLFPDAVWKCVEFLESEPGYSSAIGRTAEMHPNRPRWSCRVLRGYSIEDSCPFERCRQIATVWFNNFYAVYRTKNLLDMFLVAAASTDYAFDFNLHEFLLSQLNTLRGRVKVLPLMYQLQTRHGANASAARRVGVRPQAELQYQRFRTCLADQFALAGIDRGDAEKFIDDSYGYYRAPTWETRVPPRTTAALMRRCLHLLHGIVEKGVGLWKPGFNWHRRFIRASDLVGCEPIWEAAEKIINEYPHGIPADHYREQRVA